MNQPGQSADVPFEREKDKLPSDSESDKKLLNDHLSRFVELYKHHYDLLFKGYAIYLAIVSAIATVVLRDTPTQLATFSISRNMLIGVAFAISILSSLACVSAVNWIDKTEKSIMSLTEALKLRGLHFSEAKNFVRVIIAIGFAMLALSD